MTDYQRKLGWLNLRREQGRKMNWRALFISMGFVGIVAWFRANNVWIDRFDEPGGVYVVANILRIFITIYIAWVAYYFGRFLMRYFSNNTNKYITSVSHLDLFVFSSFLGLSGITFLIFIIGTFKLLYIWIIGPLFVVSFFAFYPMFRDDALLVKSAIASCFKFTHEDWPKDKRIFEIIAFILFLVVIVQFLCLVLFKGLYPDVQIHDLIQHYLPYIDSVIDQHGNQPNKWFLGYFVLRGSSLFFLAGLLADTQAVGLISFYLFILTGVMVFQLLNKISKNMVWALLGLIVYFSFDHSLLSLELQKTHMVVGSFLIFGFYAATVMARFEAETWRMLCFIEGVGVALISTLLYNYHYTGLMEFFPWSFCISNSNPDKWKGWFGIGMPLTMLVWDGGGTASSGLISGIQDYIRTLYSEGLVAAVLSISRTFLIWVVIIGTPVWMVIGREYFTRKTIKTWIPFGCLILGCYWMIAEPKIAEVIIKTFSVWHPYFSVSYIIKASLTFLLLVVAIVYLYSKSKCDFQYTLAVNMVVFLLIWSSVVYSTSGSSISRLAFFVRFFKVTLFTLSVKVIIECVIPRDWEKYVLVLTIMLILGLSVGQFLKPAALAACNRSTDYLLGKSSYAQIYSRFGSMYGLEVQNLAGPNKKVVMLNWCTACPGIPGTGIQHWGFSDFMKDFNLVWYGHCIEAKEALLKHGIECVWVDTNQELINLAYAPLFRADNIEKYFKIVWHSEGKYLLTWNEGVDVKRKSKTDFINKYNARIKKDMEAKKHNQNEIYEKVRQLLKSERYREYTNYSYADGERYGRY
jgi:hypothetical protein